MKAILVIDIPDDVAETYEDFTVDYDLRGTPKDDQKVIESIKYVEDYPLKPIPSRQYNYDSKMDIGYTLGWNYCLEEVEKEPYGGYKTTGVESIKPIE